MNATQRKQLEKVLSLIEDAKVQCEEMAEAEREKFDNLSQSLQETERGEAIEAAADALENAVSSLEEAFSSVEEAIGG
jgi:hypothetical protein